MFRINLSTEIEGATHRSPIASKSLWRKPVKYYCSIDMAGLLAVMVAILFAFVGPASIEVFTPRGGSVDFPQVDHSSSFPAANREDALFVAVMRNGRVFIDSTQVRPDLAPAFIRSKIGGEKRVYIKADANAEYGAVASTVEAIRAAGIKDIVFFVEEKKTRPVTSE